jgi:hypothetical protein
MLFAQDHIPGYVYQAHDIIIYLLTVRVWKPWQQCPQETDSSKLAASVYFPAPSTVHMWSVYKSKEAFVVKSK